MKIQKNKTKNKFDVKETGKKGWYYSDVVREHFFHPKNLLLKDPKEGEFDAEGMVGSPACGDMMRMWLKIDPKTERIKDLKWRTFGCASAIAATSMFSAMVTENNGLTIDEALKIKPSDVTARLDGLPSRKIHCSVLADKAFQKTANNYFRSIGQHSRITADGSKIVDDRFNITEKDIEEAVLEGALTLEGVQKKLKVGVGMSAESKANIEELVKFYREKYFGKEELK